MDEEFDLTVFAKNTTTDTDTSPKKKRKRKQKRKKPIGAERVAKKHNSDGDQYLHLTKLHRIQEEKLKALESRMGGGDEISAQYRDTYEYLCKKFNEKQQPQNATNHLVMLQNRYNNDLLHRYETSSTKNIELQRTCAEQKEKIAQHIATEARMSNMMKNLCVERDVAKKDLLKFIAESVAEKAKQKESKLKFRKTFFQVERIAHALDLIPQVQSSLSEIASEFD